MIKINLLPDHLRPVQRTPLPYILSFVVLGLAIAGMASVAITQQAGLSSLRSQLEGQQKALADLQDIVKEANELNQGKLALQSKIKTIQEILRDRIVWSEQLDRLAKLTPDNVWYKDIEVIQETFPEEVVETDVKTGEPLKDPKTGKLKYKRIRVKKPVLQVSGYVINDEEGNSVVAPLMEKTENDPAFSEQFTLYNPRLEDTEFQGFPARGFQLLYLINPRGSS